MSMRDVKWYAGAPKVLKAGMVLRAGAEIKLIGTGFVLSGSPLLMPSGNPIEAYGQVVEPYELQWLGDSGIPPKLHDPKQDV